MIKRYVGVCLIMLSIAATLPVATHGDVLRPEDKVYLLDLARQTLIWHLKFNAVPQPAESLLNDRLRRKLGCFVTLNHKVKGLRGCIGIFERTHPLYQNVISRAVAAAHDFRFASNPVTASELNDIEIEISVLTEPKALAFNSPKDLLDKLRPQVDGVIITTPYGSSTYLPQVWSYFQKKGAFLSHLCEKHGAPADAWRKGRIRVQTYQALVFHETDSERMVVGPKGAKVGEKRGIFFGYVKPPLEGRAPLAKRELKVGEHLAPGSIVDWNADLLEIE